MRTAESPLLEQITNEGFLHCLIMSKLQVIEFVYISETFTFSNNNKLSDELLHMNLVLKYQSSLNIYGKVLIFLTFYHTEKKLTKYYALVA